MRLSSLPALRAGLCGGSSRSVIAAAIGAGLMVAAMHAQAVVVYSGVVNLNIPATTNGLYLNVVTGANNLPAGGAGSTVPGWDINPWSATGLGFFNPASPAGGAYVVTAPNFAANLAPNTLIGAGSSYGAGGSANTAQWVLNSSDNLLGFRFTNEGTGLVHYGWARLGLSGTIAGARSVVEYAFESDAGVGILAGVAVVPEPSSFAMLGLGVAGLLAARRRLQQR